MLFFLTQRVAGPQQHGGHREFPANHHGTKISGPPPHLKKTAAAFGVPCQPGQTCPAPPQYFPRPKSQVLSQNPVLPSFSRAFSSDAPRRVFLFWFPSLGLEDLADSPAPAELRKRALVTFNARAGGARFGGLEGGAAAVLGGPFKKRETHISIFLIFWRRPCAE